MGIVYLLHKALVRIKGRNNVCKEFRLEPGTQDATIHLLSSGRWDTFLQYYFVWKEVVRSRKGRLYEVPRESNLKCWHFQPQYCECGSEIVESPYLKGICVVRQRLFLYTEPNYYMTMGHVLNI